MRLVLEEQAYAKFEKEAKAKGKTTRELGSEIILEWLKGKQ